MCVFDSEEEIRVENPHIHDENMETTYKNTSNFMKNHCATLFPVLGFLNGQIVSKRPKRLL